MRHERTWQSALEDIIPHLQAQVVAGDVFLQLCRLRRVEFDFKVQIPRIGAEEFGYRSFKIQPNPGIDRRYVRQTEVILLDYVQSGAD